MKSHLVVSSLVTVLALTGCVGGDTNAPAPTSSGIDPEGTIETPTTTPVAPSLRTLLARPRTLVVDPESSVGTIAVRYRDDVTPREVALGVRQGGLVVEANADGTLELRGMSFALEDIEGAPLFAGGDPVPLTDVRASIDAPMRCRPFFTDDDAEATCEVSADVTLEWSLALEDGRAWPLAPQTLGGVRIELHLFVRPDGRVGLDVASTSPSGAWAIADVAELSRFALVAEAVELPPLL
ncbi:MAG: hypothetical protein IT379_21735 [Deltaproteobacteria bacterium]|nr:hypothetical protein [Deltaproteobacteria bacterium]